MNSDSKAGPSPACPLPSIISTLPLSLSTGQTFCWTAAPSRKLMAFWTHRTGQRARSSSSCFRVPFASSAHRCWAGVEGSSGAVTWTQRLPQWSPVGFRAHCSVLKASRTWTGRSSGAVWDWHPHSILATLESGLSLSWFRFSVTPSFALLPSEPSFRSRSRSPNSRSPSVLFPRSLWGISLSR